VAREGAAVSIGSRYAPTGVACGPVATWVARTTGYDIHLVFNALVNACAIGRVRRVEEKGIEFSTSPVFPEVGLRVFGHSIVPKIAAAGKIRSVQFQAAPSVTTGKCKSGGDTDNPSTGLQEVHRHGFLRE